MFNPYPCLVFLSAQLHIYESMAIRISWFNHDFPLCKMTKKKYVKKCNACPALLTFLLNINHVMIFNYHIKTMISAVLHGQTKEFKSELLSEVDSSAPGDLFCYGALKTSRDVIMPV